MKTTLYKLSFLFLLLPGLCFSFTDNKGKHTREKKVSKEFKVSANANLEIDNSYGNVDITTWDQNRVVIEVIIKVNGNDEDKVEDKLEDINIEFNQSASGVKAKTHFSRESKSWWKNIFDGFDNVNMEVNYIIRAPETNNIDISNDYGGIYVDKLTGNAKISCDYGKIDIGELRGKANYLNFDYTRNSKIGYVKNVDINADYSDYEIEEAENIIINADYSNSKIQKAVNLEFNCDYGSINIGKVKNLKGDGDYLTTKINRIFNTLELNQDYGSVSIEKIIKGTKNVSINTDYAGVKMGYDNEMSFKFDIKTSYGSIKGMDDLEIEKRKNASTSESISGTYGSGGNAATISITTRYGSVNLTKQ